MRRQPTLRSFAPSFALPFVLGAAFAMPAHAQAPAPEPVVATSTVFSRYADRILKVQVIETGSSAKASIGTGFFVSADGLMITNYHVIAERIHEPATSRVEVLGPDGTATVAEVIAVDVVHDLAVLRTGLPSPRHFALEPVTVPQGMRLYSLGHPSDLGLSIVEGTYNGNLQHTLYPKIHFTGSINPGMSGGPTITEGGQVVGVNVSTMGEQRGFLVPRNEAAALLARVQEPGYATPAEMLTEIARQLTVYQERYLGELFAGETPMVDVGHFRVVSEPTPIFRCWGDAERGSELLYERLWHGCSTDDEVFIAGEHTAGTIEIEHEAISSKGLNAARFAALYTRRFGDDNTPEGDEKHVTVWKCATRNVRSAAGTPMRTVLCLRGLKKLPGLYDAVFKVAVLGARDAGLISTLTITGAAYDNIDRVVGRYMERIAWR
jgi:serine protease Do